MWHTHLPTFEESLFSRTEKGSAIGNLWSWILASHIVVKSSLHRSFGVHNWSRWVGVWFFQRSGLGAGSLGPLSSIAGSFLIEFSQFLAIFCGLWNADIMLKAPPCWLYQLHLLFLRGPVQGCHIRRMGHSPICFFKSITAWHHWNGGS